MSKFSGIPSGRLGFTSVPNIVFSELLPMMDDVTQIQVTLYIFYLLSQKKGTPRYVTLEELRGDATLMQAMEFDAKNLERGLEKSVSCGALLQIEADDAVWYLFHTAESRRAIEKIQNGELKLAANVRIQEGEAQETPNIFKLYEREIGMLTPIIAEELKEVEREKFPPEVILDAFRSAAENNKRSWRYVSKILQNWARENKHEKVSRPASRERRPVVTGKLADLARSKQNL